MTCLRAEVSRSPPISPAIHFGCFLRYTLYSSTSTGDALSLIHLLYTRPSYVSKQHFCQYGRHLRLCLHRNQETYQHQTFPFSCRKALTYRYNEEENEFKELPVV